jgi:hypothetical protein
MSRIARVKKREDEITLSSRNRFHGGSGYGSSCCCDLFGIVEQSHDIYISFGVKYFIIACMCQSDS